MSDLNMLAVTGGRERSEIEWRGLLASAWFSLNRVISILDDSMKDVSIIEAVSSPT